MRWRRTESPTPISSPGRAGSGKPPRRASSPRPCCAPRAGTRSPAAPVRRAGNWSLGRWWMSSRSTAPRTAASTTSAPSGRTSGTPPPPPELLSASLERIRREEKVEFAPAALPLLVRSAEGSLRDALSLLDTALAYGGGRLAADSLAHLLGASAPAQVRGFVGALVARGGAGAPEAIDRARSG